MRTIVFRLLLVIVVAIPGGLAPARSRAAVDRAPAPAAPAAPIRFEPNVGQLPGEARFAARYAQAPVTFAADAATFAVGGRDVVMRLLGAQSACSIAGEDAAPGVANYFVGDDPSRWHRNVPQYRRLRYREIYPDVDLVFYERDGRLEYDFVAAPGAEPASIRVRFDGADAVELAPDGALVVRVRQAELRHLPPVVYQELPGGRAPVAARYDVAQDGTVGFELGAYDTTAPVVIDPSIVYSTLLGGGLSEMGKAIATDAAGSLYVAGWTSSQSFPVRDPLAPFNPGTRPDGGDLGECFVTKFTPDGSDLVFSTHIGGGYFDEASAIAVGADGSVYVAGATWSKDFPTVRPIRTNTDFIDNPYSDGIKDPFVLKISADGSELLYSTYLGGGQRDEVLDIEVDASGALYVAGETGSTDFPTTPTAFQPTDPNTAGPYGNTLDAFVAKIDPSGTRLVFSTYLSGSEGYSSAAALALGEQGEVYVTGFALANGFLSGRVAFHFLGLDGGTEAYAAVLEPDGRAVRWATLIGGTYDERGRGIAVDATGVYVAGSTTSPNFYTFRPIHTNADGEWTEDGFVMKLEDDGQRAAYSTYLGGTREDVIEALLVDGQGRAVVTGWTRSNDFPVKDANYPFSHHTYEPMTDAFVATLDATGSALAQSTYLGGYESDVITDMAWSGPNEVAVAGWCDGRSFPIVAPFLADTYDDGGLDAFVMKYSIAPPTSQPTILKAKGRRLAAGKGYRATITGQGFLPGAIVFARNAYPHPLRFTGTVKQRGKKILLTSQTHGLDVLFNEEGEHVVVVVNPDGGQAVLTYTK